VVVGGAVTLEAIGRSLAGTLGGVQVFDRTNNTDKFNVVLEFVLDENTPGPRFLTPAPAQPSPVATGSSRLDALPFNFRWGLSILAEPIQALSGVGRLLDTLVAPMLPIPVPGTTCEKGDCA
jgi:hypothetical protein